MKNSLAKKKKEMVKKERKKDTLEKEGKQKKMCF